MTPQQALDRIADFCNDRERRYRENRGDPALASVAVVDLRGVLEHVERTPAGLVITEAEAGILLALIDGAPLAAADVEQLATMTGRLAALDPATGSHRAVAV